MCDYLATHQPHMTTTAKPLTDRMTTHMQCSCGHCGPVADFNPFCPACGVDSSFGPVPPAEDISGAWEAGRRGHRKPENMSPAESAEWNRGREAWNQAMDAALA